MPLDHLAFELPDPVVSSRPRLNKVFRFWRSRFFCCFQTLSTNQRGWKKSRARWLGCNCIGRPFVSTRLRGWIVPTGWNRLRPKWGWIENWYSNFISRWHTHPLSLSFSFSYTHTHTHSFAVLANLLFLFTFQSPIHTLTAAAAYLEIWILSKQIFLLKKTHTMGRAVKVWKLNSNLFPSLGTGDTD